MFILFRNELYSIGTVRRVFIRSLRFVFVVIFRRLYFTSFVFYRMWGRSAIFQYDYMDNAYVFNVVSILNETDHRHEWI